MGMSNEITHNFQNNFKKDNFFMASFSLRKDGMRRIKNPVCGDGKREFFFYCRAQARAQGDAPARGETGRKEDERGERKGRESAAANSDSFDKGADGKEKTGGKRSKEKSPFGGTGFAHCFQISVLCHRREFFGEFGLLVGSPVLVEESFGRRAVDGGDRGGVELGRLFLVARFDGGEELLDGSLHGGIDGFILFGLFLGYQYAFFGRFDVRHFFLLLTKVIFEYIFFDIF